MTCSVSSGILIALSRSSWLSYAYIYAYRIVRFLSCNWIQSQDPLHRPGGVGHLGRGNR
jgi:hypothetical protein